MVASVASIPVLTAEGRRSVTTEPIWASTCSAGMTCTSCTPTVFWAVTAVTAVVPYTPSAAKALRSAWMPAAPPESEPAMVRATDVVGVADPEAAAAGRAQRHHRGATDLLQAAGEHGVVAGVRQHHEALVDQTFSRLEELDGVREQRPLVADHLQLHPARVQGL